MIMLPRVDHHLCGIRQTDTPQGPSTACARHAHPGFDLDQELGALVDRGADTSVIEEMIASIPHADTIQAAFDDWCADGVVPRYVEGRDAFTYVWDPGHSWKFTFRIYPEASHETSEA